MTDNYSLELRDIDESDAGQYSCQLDVFGHTQTVLHNLTVLGTILLKGESKKGACFDTQLCQF